MSYCKEQGNDKMVFLTKEDDTMPSSELIAKVLRDDDDDYVDVESQGAVLPNGEINWACPCFGGMPTGPCSVEFRDAFSCFVKSETEPKGSDCMDNFRNMTECLGRNPSLYSRYDDDDEPGNDADLDIDTAAIAEAVDAAASSTTNTLDKNS